MREINLNKIRRFSFLQQPPYIRLRPLLYTNKKILGLKYMRILYFMDDIYVQIILWLHFILTFYDFLYVKFCLFQLKTFRQFIRNFYERYVQKMDKNNEYNLNTYKIHSTLKCKSDSPWENRLVRCTRK